MNAPITTYNGWKNWETWNVALWVDNEESLYRLRLIFKPKTADEVKGFVQMVFPNGTPDFEKGRSLKHTPNWFYKTVDWDEIADHWKEDYDEEDEGE